MNPLSLSPHPIQPASFFTPISSLSFIANFYWMHLICVCNKDHMPWVHRFDKKKTFFYSFFLCSCLHMNYGFNLFFGIWGWIVLCCGVSGLFVFVFWFVNFGWWLGFFGVEGCLCFGGWCYLFQWLLDLFFWGCCMGELFQWFGDLGFGVWSCWCWFCCDFVETWIVEWGGSWRGKAKGMWCSLVSLKFKMRFWIWKLKGKGLIEAVPESNKH